jgi:hypothetical protein
MCSGQREGGRRTGAKGKQVATKERKKERRRKEEE